MKQVANISILLFISISFNLRGQIYANATEAFELSRASQKPVLLVFSGSDWCAPCIKFQKTVLSSEDFQHFASDHFILLRADFPQRKKLPKDLIAQNEKLAERYNPRGLFPHILLLHPDQSIMATLFFKNQGPEKFISEVSAHFAE